MKYEKIVEYSNTKFRRITGVKRATYDKMVEILRKGYAEKHRRRGRTPKLSIEDLLLATLEYLREYRTYAHISASYGIAESNIYRGIKWVEDTLIRDGTFSLPGRKAPLKSDAEYEVILVDATQSPIERPKKAKAILFRKEKTAHTKNTAACQPSDRRNYCAGIFQRKKARFPTIQGFPCSCQGRNSIGSRYRIPRSCSDIPLFSSAEKAFQESSLVQTRTQT